MKRTRKAIYLEIIFNMKLSDVKLNSSGRPFPIDALAGASWYCKQSNGLVYKSIQLKEPVCLKAANGKLDVVYPSRYWLTVSIGLEVNVYSQKKFEIYFKLVK